MRFEKVREECFIEDSAISGAHGDYNNAYKNIKIPDRRTACSAGYDFSTPYKVFLPPHGRAVIPTGIKAVDMPKNVCLMLYIRSSVGIRHGVVFSNGTGVIDADYANNETNDGDIHLALFNTSNAVVSFNEGDRLAQGVFVKYETVDDDDASGERVGGMGSSGV